MGELWEAMFLRPALVSSLEGDGRPGWRTVAGLEAEAVWLITAPLGAGRPRQKEKRSGAAGSANSSGLAEKRSSTFKASSSMQGF